MSRVAGYFLRGLLVVAPVAVTGYVCWVLVRAVDRALDFGIPGLGILVTAAGITLIGLLASSLATRGLLGWLDRGLEKLPFVRLLYSSTKDLLNAVVGERRRFTRPVRFRIDETSEVWSLGFITADSLPQIGLSGHVPVYVPFSYSLSGRLFLVPASRLEPVAASGSDMLAFIISGGVATGVQESGLRTPDSRL